MSSYNELVKNFERVRAYMREFYVYGFKSRTEYDEKSARSYDDERRRMESWLGDNMSFVRTAEGKNMFISIDSRVSSRNPLYKAWKAKSFTDGDITLHFVLMDILHSPDIVLPLSDITRLIDQSLRGFEAYSPFDESTVRKKLKEYAEEGIIESQKQGRTTLYRRSSGSLTDTDTDGIHFFSEVLPCGVIGSFITDKFSGDDSDIFTFKHHYITQSLDSDVLAALFECMRKKCAVTFTNISRHSMRKNRVTVVPLRVLISTQNGRQYLIAYQRGRRFQSYRLDYISDVSIGEPVPRFDELREKLNGIAKNIWGVSCNGKIDSPAHVEFTVYVGKGEDYILDRLNREKRGGKIEQIDENHYRFTADVYDTSELIPWIRTFICRITQLNFSDRTIENRFKQDIQYMYKMYGLEGGDGV